MLRRTRFANGLSQDTTNGSFAGKIVVVIAFLVDQRLSHSCCSHSRVSKCGLKLAQRRARVNSTSRGEQLILGHFPRVKLSPKGRPEFLVPLALDRPASVLPLRRKERNRPTLERNVAGTSSSAQSPTADGFFLSCRSAGRFFLSACLASLLDRLGTSAEVWSHRIKRLFGKKRLLGSYFATDPDRLRQLARQRGVHHLDNLVPSPAEQASARRDCCDSAFTRARSCAK